MAKLAQDRKCRWCGARLRKDFYQVEGRCYCGHCMESFHKEGVYDGQENG